MKPYSPYTCLGKRPWGPYGLDVSDYGKGNPPDLEWASVRTAGKKREVRGG